MATSVRVPLDAALVGRLPPVCAMTGERAGGYAPVVVPRSLGIAWLLLLAGPIGLAVLIGLYPRLRTRYVVRIPLSDAAFERWHRARVRRLWCSWLGAMGIVVAVALRWLGPLWILVLAGSVGLLGVALRAHLRIPWLVPSMHADRTGRRVTMQGVHDRFAAAVATHLPIA